MKGPISGENLFEDFVEKIEWNQESVAVQIRIHRLRLFLWRTQTSKNVGYTKTIAHNGLAKLKQ